MLQFAAPCGAVNTAETFFALPIVFESIQMSPPRQNSPVSTLHTQHALHDCRACECSEVLKTHLISCITHRMFFDTAFAMLRPPVNILFTKGSNR